MYLSDYLAFFLKLHFSSIDFLEYFQNSHCITALTLSLTAIIIAALNLVSVWEKEGSLFKKLLKTGAYFFILVLAIGSAWYQSLTSIETEQNNIQLDSINEAQDSLFKIQLQANFDSLKSAYDKLAVAERTSSELQAEWRRVEVAKGSFPIISFQRERQKFIELSNDSSTIVDLLHFYIENDGPHVLKNVEVEFYDEFGVRFRELAVDKDFKNLEFYRIIGEGINVGAFQRISVGSLYPNEEPRKFFTAAIGLDKRKDVIPGATLLDRENEVHYDRLYIDWHSDGITYGFELGPDYDKNGDIIRNGQVKIYMLGIYGKYEDQYEIYSNHLDYLSDRFVRDVGSWESIWGY